MSSLRTTYDVVVAFICRTIMPSAEIAVNNLVDASIPLFSNPIHCRKDHGSFDHTVTYVGFVIEKHVHDVHPKYAFQKGEENPILSGTLSHAIGDRICVDGWLQ